MIITKTCFILYQEEHDTILRNREDANSGLTWKEYKSMTYTFQVEIDNKNFVKYVSKRISSHLTKC